jgi:hypothetical protein
MTSGFGRALESISNNKELRTPSIRKVSVIGLKESKPSDIMALPSFHLLVTPV